MAHVTFSIFYVCVLFVNFVLREKKNYQSFFLKLLSLKFLELKIMTKNQSKILEKIFEWGSHFVHTL